MDDCAWEFAWVVLCPSCIAQCSDIPLPTVLGSSLSILSELMATTALSFTNTGVTREYLVGQIAPVLRSGPALLGRYMYSRDALTRLSASKGAQVEREGAAANSMAHDGHIALWVDIAPRVDIALRVDTALRLRLRGGLGPGRR